MRVPSSDHVSVAVHELGGTGSPLLLSHATGFHGYCHLPIADELADRFCVWSIDHRGHGSTARPDDWQVDWTRYGDDTLAVARAIAPDGGLVAFGHSMGAAALLMAADKRPDLFELIVAFEPIVFPTDAYDPTGPPPAMADGARRRRASFPSFDAAIAHLGSKPPMAAFDADVLRLYVAHGFRPAPEGIRLKCDPEHEARTLASSWSHDTWDRLPGIESRVVIVAGHDGDGPAAIALRVAERLPNATMVELPDADHFWPLVDPRSAARVISTYA